ncbi:MAG: primosomal protein N' [Burkholderiaceae bacterium]
MNPRPYAAVLLDVPIAAAFDYRIPAELDTGLQAGDWVVVPWARQRRVGIVLERREQPAIDAARVRELSAMLAGAPRLDQAWLSLGEFAAGYYHCQPGELLIPAVPKRLRRAPGLAQAKRRTPTRDDFADARRRFDKQVWPGADADETPPALTPDQQAALAAILAAQGYRCWLLHGITGSGKTEVYLRWLRSVLATKPSAQVLLLVPEIALTPQLAARVRARLAQPCAILHSAMPETERAAHWLAAAEGRARVIIGTRLAALAPLPGLAAIVVDEEHDTSFKQQEHPHYSARDLAIARAHAAAIPIVLGSATPSLESWHAAARGRYGLLSMTHRATGADLPTIEIVPLRDAHGKARRGPARDSAAPTPASPQADDPASPKANDPAVPNGANPPLVPPEGLTEEAFAALRQTLAEGAQTLVFLNRRGFAPVLGCAHCGWLSQCDACSAYRVLHRRARGEGRQRFMLICHHCASNAAVPPRCPSCGDPELIAIGRGTQRIEELLAQALPQARIARLDRDVARRAGATQAVFDRLHGGEIDIIIGTQMLAKGHDVRRLALVIVLDADGALFSSDFRGPERLFAMLTQVAGRAGRHDGRGRVIIQTRFASHPVFNALLAHDYPSFANTLLQERREAGLPPLTHHAMLRAQAGELDEALRFLATAKRAGQGWLDSTNSAAIIYDPVPMPLARVANISRAQLLIESASRPELHAFLHAWRASLLADAGRVRWQLEVDPIEI